MMWRAQEANGVCPTDEDSHMVKAWSSVDRQEETMDQEDAIRDVIDEKIEEVCQQLLQRHVDSHVMIQDSARGHLIQGRHKRAMMIQVYWRQYLARKLCCSLLLLRQEEEDDEIIVTS